MKRQKQRTPCQGCSPGGRPGAGSPERTRPPGGGHAARGGNRPPRDTAHRPRGRVRSRTEAGKRSGTGRAVGETGTEENTGGRTRKRPASTIRPRGARGYGRAEQSRAEQREADSEAGGRRTEPDARNPTRSKHSPQGFPGGQGNEQSAVKTGSPECKNHKEAPVHPAQGATVNKSKQHTSCRGCREREPSLLLVGTEAGAATRDGTTGPQKTRVTIWSSHPTPGHLSRPN